MTDQQTNGKTRFELIVKLIGALAWPTFAFVLLIALWSPLRSIASQLPGIVGRSETITIAGLSITVSKGLQRQASEPVAAALAALSPDGFRKLVDTGNESYWSKESISHARAENAELVKLKLLEEIPDQDLQRSDRSFGYGIRPTPLGKEAREYVLALLDTIVEEMRRRQ